MLTRCLPLLRRAQIHVMPFGGEADAGGAAAALRGQPPHLCRDNNESCAEWARLGECDKNPLYMKARPGGGELAVGRGAGHTGRGLGNQGLGN